MGPVLRPHTSRTRLFTFAAAAGTIEERRHFSPSRETGVSPRVFRCLGQVGAGREARASEVPEKALTEFHNVPAQYVAGSNHLCRCFSTSVLMSCSRAMYTEIASFHNERKRFSGRYVHVTKTKQLITATSYTLKK